MASDKFEKVMNLMYTRPELRASIQIIEDHIVYLQKAKEDAEFRLLGLRTAYERLVDHDKGVEV